LREGWLSKPVPRQDPGACNAVNTPATRQSPVPVCLHLIKILTTKMTGETITTTATATTATATTATASSCCCVARDKDTVQARDIGQGVQRGSGPYGNLFQLTFNIHFCISSFEEKRSLTGSVLPEILWLEYLVNLIPKLHLKLEKEPKLTSCLKQIKYYKNC